MKGPTQYNFANDNSTLNATQIVNYIDQRKIPKMLTPDPVPYSHYVSQNNEYEIIKKLEKNRKVFLHGVGGIGKTTLAKRIYELSKKRYDHLAWIDFKGNWKTSLVNGIFTSFFHFEKNITEDEKYNRIIECLTNLHEGKNILIVVDNFNIPETGALNEILRLSATILITTRCNFQNSKYYYDLTPLDTEHGKKLFIQNYITPERLTFADDTYIEEIVKISRGYPLAIELIARAISYQNIQIKEFLEELKSKEYEIKAFDLSADSDWNGLQNEKIAGQLSKVYQLSELSPEEVQLLKIISILPANSVIASNDLQKYVPFDCKNAQISLVCRGWITQSQYGFFMHEIVCVSIYKYNAISYNECELLLTELEKSTKVSPETNVISALKYAKYVYNIINIKRLDLKFSRHLFLKEAALVFKETGNYNQAIELLEVLISVYDEKNVEDKNVLAEVYNNYSKVLSMEGNTEIALGKALDAERLIDSISEDSDKEYYLKKMIIKKTVAMDYAHLKKYKEALSKIKEALKIVDFISQDMHYQVTNLYSDYARLLLDTGDILKSIDNYKKVLTDYDSQGIEENSPWRYTTYTHLANAYALNRQMINANNYAFQALTGKYSIYSENNYAIANALLSMANIYQSEKNLWDVAEVFYKKAISIFKKDDMSDNYCRCLAGLSGVTQNIDLAIKAYDILQSGNKVYDIYTYLDVIEALMPTEPEKALQLGTEALNLYISQKDQSVIQYVYALMGKASYLLDDNDKAETYLRSIDISHIKDSTYFQQATEKIEASIPLLKMYSEEGSFGIMDKDNGVIFTVNGGQLNISKDDSTLYANQYNTSNNSQQEELENVIKAIKEDISSLEKQKADELMDIIDMVKTELAKPAPQPSRLRNCVTLLGPMFTVANGIPTLLANLHGFQDLILQIIK